MERCRAPAGEGWVVRRWCGLAVIDQLHIDGPLLLQCEAERFERRPLRLLTLRGGGGDALGAAGSDSKGMRRLASRRRRSGGGMLR